MARTKTIDPVWSAAFLILFFPAAILLPIPETGAALALVAVFFMVTIYSRKSATALLLLLAPFFLGSSNMPYFWLLDVFIYILILVWAISALARKSGFVIPLKYPVALVAIAAMFSFPVNIKEFFLALWAEPISNHAYLWYIGFTNSHIYHLKVLTNILSGIGLFYVTFNVYRNSGRDEIEKVLRSLVVMAIYICLAGVILYYTRIAENHGMQSYLGLSLVGHVWQSITSFSYNHQYLAQWLTPLIPIVIYLIFRDRKEKKWLIIHGVSMALIIFTLAQGGQRSAYISIGIMTLITPGVIIYLKSSRTRPVLVYAFCVAALLAFVASGRLASGGFLSGDAMSKLVEVWAGYKNDPLYFMRRGVLEPRFFLWHTAVVMFGFSPLLGIGLGRYHYLFDYFYQSDWRVFEDIGFASGTAHSLYLQTLAEQGIIGVASWSVFTACLFIAAIRSAGQKTGADKWLIIAVSSSLIMWLFMGVTHNIAHVRSMGMVFWIYGAILALLSRTHVESSRVGARYFRWAMAGMVIALVWQVSLAWNWTVREGFASGVYIKEKQPDGRYARWSGKRAVWNIRPIKSKIRFSVSAPLPGIGQKPQKVMVWSENFETKITLASTKWKNVAIPSSAQPGLSQIVWFETEYVFNPKKDAARSDDRDLGVMIRIDE